MHEGVQLWIESIQSMMTDSLGHLLQASVIPNGAEMKSNTVTNTNHFHARGKGVSMLRTRVY